MRSIELGLVLPMEEAWTDGSTPRWVEIRELAMRAEAIGEERERLWTQLQSYRGYGDLDGFAQRRSQTAVVVLEPRP